MVEFLIEHGADPAARSKDGETILDAAQSGCNPELIEWLTQLLAHAQ